MRRGALAVLLRQDGKVSCFCIGGGGWAFGRDKDNTDVTVLRAVDAGEKGLFGAAPGAVCAGGAEEEAPFGVGGRGVVEGGGGSLGS